MTDPEQIQLQIDVALNGLSQIRQFTRMDKANPNWEFHTFSNPVTAFHDAEKQREQYLLLEAEERERVARLMTSSSSSPLRIEQKDPPEDSR